MYSTALPRLCICRIIIFGFLCFYITIRNLKDIANIDNLDKESEKVGFNEPLELVLDLTLLDSIL